MKRVFFLAMLMISSITAFAQREAGEVSVKPAVGVSSTNISGMEGSAHIGFVVGADVEYQMTDIFAVSGGLYYSASGCQTSNMDVIPLKYKKHIHNQYLTVPVLLNAYVADGFALKAGLQAGFLLDSELEVETKETYDKDSVKDLLNNFDLALPVGLSYEYQNIVFEAKYNIGLTNIIKDKKASEFKNCKNSILQFTIGYRF